MTTRTDPLQSFASSGTDRPLKSVAVVSRYPQPGVLDAVLDAGDYDVVFIESMDRAFSQIKRCTPRLVILCLDMDDAGCFQILSMLQLDGATADIPVITYVMEPTKISSSERPFEIDRDAVAQPAVLSMN